MAGLQCAEGRMIIDLVVWAQYINVIDTLTHKQPHSHVAIAIAALTHCVVRQKNTKTDGQRDRQRVSLL